MLPPKAAMRNQIMPAIASTLPGLVIWKNTLSAS